MCSKRRPIPSQVDESAFKVGENLAVTPGSVVLRTEMFELIQYAPQTEQVHQRPVLVVPSIVNKYYVFDLAPKRSILEYYVQKGMTVFVMVWRNPQPRHDRWGMSDYQDAVDARSTRRVRSPNRKTSTCGPSAAPARSLFRWLAITPPRRRGRSIACYWLFLRWTCRRCRRRPRIGAFVDAPGSGRRLPVVKKVASQQADQRDRVHSFVRDAAGQ